MEARGFVDALGRFVADVFEPLAQALSDPDLFVALLRDLGWQAPDADVDLDKVSAHLAFIPPLTRVIELSAIVAQADQPAAADVAELSEKVIEVVNQLVGVASRPVPVGLSAPLSDPRFWKDAGDAIGALLLARYLSGHRPIVYAALYLLGLIEEQETAVATGAVGGRMVMRWDRLPVLLRDPVAVMCDVYGWKADFKHVRLIRALEETLRAAGLPAWRVPPAQDRVERHYGPLAPPPERLAELVVPIVAGEEPLGDGAVSAEVGLLILPIPSAPGGAPVGLFIGPYANGQIVAEIPVSETTLLRIEGTVDATGSAGIRLLPDAVSGFSESGTLAGGLRVELAHEPATPLVLLGGREGTGAFVEAMSLALGLAGSGSGGAELSLELGFVGLAARLDFGDRDEFVGNLIGAAGGTTVRLDGALIWSSISGLAFRGGGGLRLSLPIQESLGPLCLQRLDFAVELGGSGKDSTASIAASVTFDASLGPVAVTVDRIGAKLELVDDPNGPLAGLAPRLAFKPPSGAGLEIDAGVVVGGGYLLFDPEREQYAGAVHLEVAKKLTITAFGLITTRMPDGSPGFSLLVLIAVRFEPGVPLGYGFTLGGIGGLLGVNRTVSVEPLRAGLRAGTIGRILFPEDPIRNAPQIVSDLQTVFPAAPGRFVFGPMVQIGWGTPKTLLTIDVGLVLELPSPVRLFILGRLRLALPDEKPVVRLQLDSLGMIDFERGDVALDAVLYDSQISEFAVTGEMALRASFGSNPNFVLAVGGFHPRFKALEGFPALERVSISLATSNNPRLRLEAYLALTTNSVQFGALVEVFAEAAGFSLHGHLGFDTLIQFQPFGLLAQLRADVALKRGNASLMSVMVDMTLTGPAPWRAQGRANFKLLFLSGSIGFDVEIGRDEPIPLPSPENLRPLLLRELSDRGNWATQLPSSERPVVSLASQAAVDELHVHPLANLEVRQRVLPLGREINRFGNADVDGERVFEVGVVGPDNTVGTGAAAAVTPVMDFFAPAQFRQMSDDEKLVAPSFEQMQAGIRFGVRTYTAGKAIREELSYEAKTLHGPSGTRAVRGSVASTRPAPLPVELVASLGSAGSSRIERTGVAKYSGARLGIALQPLQFAAVADQVQPVARIALRRSEVQGEVSRTASYSEVFERAHRGEQEPRRRPRVRVVPFHEDVSR